MSKCIRDLRVGTILEVRHRAQGAGERLKPLALVLKEAGAVDDADFVCKMIGDIARLEAEAEAALGDED